MSTPLMHIPEDIEQVKAIIKILLEKKNPSRFDMYYIHLLSIHLGEQQESVNVDD